MLQPRDLQILGFVARHGVCTPGQLRRRFWPSAHVNGTYRSVEKLVQHGYLTTDRTWYHGPLAVRVTQLGLRSAGLPFHPFRLTWGRLPHQLAMVDLSEELLARHQDATWRTQRELRLDWYADRARGIEHHRLPDGMMVLGGCSPTAGGPDAGAVPPDPLAPFRGDRRRSCAGNLGVLFHRLTCDLMTAEDAADRLMAELLRIWRETEPPLPDAPAATAPTFMDVPTTVPPSANPPLSSLGAELGERLVSEILDGVKAGRQGILISEPDRLRTAIFVRGLSLGDFARRAGLARRRSRAH